MMEPNLDDARRFLELLGDDDDLFVFQTFDDSPRKDQNLGRSIFGSLDRLQEALRDRQEHGAGVFVTINRCTGQKRKAENVDLIRAVFCDLDGAPLQPVMACALAPHIVVESSPGKFHAYWRCEDVPLDQFKPLQKAIARRFNGDKAVHDLPRVMRCPGFVHQKGEPFLTRIIEVNEGLPYDLSELLAEFPLDVASGGNGLDDQAVDDGDVATMRELVRQIQTGEKYHDPLRNLAWRYLAEGMAKKSVIQTLQGHMDASGGARDDRWQARYNDIPRAVESARAKLGKTSTIDLTDDALACELGEAWIGAAHYVELWGRWVFWRPEGWRMDETRLAWTRARSWLRDKAQALIKARPGMTQRAANLCDAHTITAVTNLMRSNAELASHPDAWDRNPWLLGGPGTTVDLRTGEVRGEVREARPEDYILRRTSCAPAAPGVKPELWLRFLERVTNGDRELQDFLQRLCGYWLTGCTDEETFAFIYGTGANGKSKFLGTIQAILGDYADTIGAEMLMQSDHDRHPTELARLKGLRLAVAYETEEGRTWAESRIKALTGSDRITGRFMRQDFFTFTPEFKLAIIGNHKPNLRRVDEAIKRRMHVVPFDVTIPPAERDHDLSRKLAAEHPAILRWMIDGCLDWQLYGLWPPARVIAATDDYFTEEDRFEAWRAECVEKDAPDKWIPFNTLWLSWQDWARGAGEPVGTKKAFGTRLKAHPAFKHGLRPKVRTTIYYGCKLRSAAEGENG